MAVDVVNIAAGFYLDRARKVLSGDAIDPSSMLGHIPETHEARAIAEINASPAKSRRWLLLKNFGHRAVLDYELAEPRYAEDLNTLNRMIAGRVQAGRPAYQNTPALSKSQAKIVDVARRFQTLKEDAKHHSLSEMAVLRRAVLTLDRRFGLDGRVFCLRFDELFSLNGAECHAAARACEVAAGGGAASASPVRRCPRSCWPTTSKRRRPATRAKCTPRPTSSAARAWPAARSWRAALA